MFFPADILERIFVLLTSQRDRNSVSLVCKYWCKVEAGCRLRVSVKNCYALGPQRVLARFPKMRALSLKGRPHFAGLNLVDWGGIALPWIEFFAVNCPWLQVLRLKRMVVSDRCLQLISLSFSRFESLSLIRCQGFSPNGLASIASNCRYRKNSAFEDSIFCHGFDLFDSCMCLIFDFFVHNECWGEDDSFDKLFGNIALFLNSFLHFYAVHFTQNVIVFNPCPMSRENVPRKDF